MNFLLILLVVPCTIATTLLRCADAGSKDKAKCFFDYPCLHSCATSPADGNGECQLSIDAACRRLSPLAPQTGKEQAIIYSTSQGNDFDSTGQKRPNGNTKYIAIARTSSSIKEFPKAKSCKKEFKSIPDCSRSSNKEFDGNCVGGGIDPKYCTGYYGNLVSGDAPAYLLGTPNELSFFRGSSYMHYEGDDDTTAIVDNYADSSWLGPSPP